MTTELQAAAAEIEKKVPKRMNEEELTNWAAKIAYYPAQISQIVELAKKYAGEL